MAHRPAVLRLPLVPMLLAGTFAAIPAPAQDRLTVVSVDPQPQALRVPSDRPIRIEFDRPLDPASVSEASVWAFGRWSGVAGGEVRIFADGRKIKLTPERRFSAGETVTVFLSSLRAMDGTGLRDAGFSYQYWIRSQGEGFDFEETGRFSTRSSPERSTRAYGGFGSDLDGDGFLDLTIVNEDTDDLRTFMNEADYSGSFSDFLRPFRSAGNVPSPSEPSDFDRDGVVDVVVANTHDDSVSVLLGRGDGTFRRAEHYIVGGEPRGVAVLDADGDGDVDVAATSFVDGTVTVLLNDGAAGFDETTTFGTDSGERAIAAADMNGDGILDLVVGALSAERIDVYLGSGDGDFSLASSQSAGGQVWLLNVGDVDRDGAEDVAVVNSMSDNAAILRGDGAGGLAPPVTIDTDPFPLATDLADLDGDGDLDWVISSFSGDWVLWENDGAGDFTRDRSFDAPQAASCSIAMDLDNDEVLDLVLIDELQDEVVLLKSHAVLFESDLESGSLEKWPKLVGPVALGTPGLRRSAHALEFGATGRRVFANAKLRPRESSLEVGFDLDLQGLDPGDEELVLFSWSLGNGALTLSRSGNKRRLTYYVHDWAAQGLRKVGSVGIKRRGPTRLRLEWLEASGPVARDGYAALFKNGRRRGAAFDLATSTRGDGGVGGFRVGLVGRLRSATGGPLLIDNVRVTR